MEITDRIPVKSDKTASRIIDGEAVIVLLEQQETLVLNDTGSRIWEIIDGNMSVGQLTGAIAAEFNVSYEEALRDTASFVEDMARKGALFFKDNG